MSHSLDAFKNNIAAAEQSVRTRFDGFIDQAVILGTGLSGLNLDGFEQIMTIPYTEISGLVPSTAPSHSGTLDLLSNGSKTIALCSGRQHLYEGYSAWQVSTLIYALAKLGAHDLIVTNAAGSLNPEITPGEVMMIQDHINFTGQNPVVGQDETFGLRFPDMSQAYNRALREKMLTIANTKNVDLHSGVYVGVLGPSLETSAERRMFRIVGGDAIGMSTVLEVIAANHAGMNVLGLSAITNLALGDENQQPDTLEEVLANAANAGTKIKALLEQLLTTEDPTGR